MVKTIDYEKIFISLTISGFSQTKLIAFKSHSGKMANFEKALMNPSFDLINHNLGMAPQPTVTNSELDAVIFVSDSVSIMVTSTVCQNSPWYYGNDTTVDYQSKTLWASGSDTVINHPLFSKQHSLDSIKAVLKSDYYFRNDIDSITFIGFDNGEVEIEEDKESIPVVPNDAPAPPSGLGFMVVILTVFALFIGLIAWRMSRIKQEQAIGSV